MVDARKLRQKTPIGFAEMCPPIESKRLRMHKRLVNVENKCLIWPLFEWTREPIFPPAPRTAVDHSGTFVR
jgi:hypothetical protein